MIISVHLINIEYFNLFTQKLSHLQFENQEKKLDELNNASGKLKKSQNKENQPNNNDQAGCSLNTMPLRSRNHQGS